MASFQVLLEKWSRDEMAAAELEEFLALLEADASPMAAPILEDLHNNPYPGFTDPAQRQRMLARILEANRRGRKTRIIRILQRATAAAVLITMITGAWLWFRHSAPPGSAQLSHNDIAPGGNKAVLTLGDGSTITLDSAHNGKLAIQGNTRVIKGDGRLIYRPGRNGSIVYNSVTTPRGGQYQLILADGSKVWLNSASSLRYPTAFTTTTRTVELSGEGYFEVAKNSKNPFIVKIKDVSVKVLGTHFDIMAYPDEAALNTTLIEGAVTVTNGAQTRTLAPGQQALVGPGNSAISVQPADIDKAIAWTTGFFKFDHSDLHSIMREISRWYDIEIAYETSDNNETYGGRIRRDLNLSVLIKFLEANGIHHFRIEGKRLVVLP
jgi:transmembrane sensor